MHISQQICDNRFDCNITHISLNTSKLYMENANKQYLHCILPQNDNAIIDEEAIYESKIFELWKQHGV